LCGANADGKKKVMKKQRRSKRKRLTEKDFFVARIGVLNPVNANHPGAEW
jgi:hypothetical protein